jgi:hypothetical protein
MRECCLCHKDFEPPANSPYRTNCSPCGWNWGRPDHLPKFKDCDGGCYNGRLGDKVCQRCAGAGKLKLEGDQQ